MPTETRLKTGLHNTSEIGRLKKVMLHRPGQELENLMPEYLERLLFDDIPYLKVAQAEHDAFAQCLRDNGAEVVYLRDLVEETLAEPDVRRELTEQFLDEAGLENHRIREILQDYFAEMDNGALVDTMMAGVRKSDIRGFETGKLADYLSFRSDEYPFLIDPMPNLYFTRDPFATIEPGDPLWKIHLPVPPGLQGRPQVVRPGRDQFPGGRGHPHPVPGGPGGGHLPADGGGQHRQICPHGAVHQQDVQEDPGVQHPQEPQLYAPGHGLHHGGPGQVYRTPQHPQRDHRICDGAG